MGAAFQGYLPEESKRLTQIVDNPARDLEFTFYTLFMDFLQTTQSKGGYSLHGQQGDKNHGNERAGFLQKRSEG